MSVLHLPSSVRTGGVALPRSVESEVAREQAQAQLEMEFISERLRHFNKGLREIDEHLQVVLAKPNTTIEGLKPNYYHLVRMRPGHPAYIKPVEHENGEWRDLDSSVYELAAEDDLWNDRLQRDRRRVQAAARAAAQRQRERERQDRVDEMNRRWHSKNSVSISVPREVTAA